MEKIDFEQQIKDTLTFQAKKITPSEGLLSQIHAELDDRKEQTTMKWSISKKIVTIAAAICILTVGCYAATQLEGVTSHSQNKYTKYEDMSKAEKKAGFDAKLIETFSNGYTFVIGGFGEQYGTDENGNAVSKVYPQIVATYEKEEQEIILFVSNGDPMVDAGQEIASGYSSQDYKFVPPDYEKTAEDLAKEASGELMISYGSNTVEENNAENYMWADGDIYYSLTAFDAHLGEEAMKQMADELMQGK